MISAISILGLIPLIIIAVAGAANAETVTIQSYDYNRQPVAVEFTKIPQRVITTNGSTTEIMLRLGLEKHMVGTALLDNPVMPDLQEAYERVPILTSWKATKEMVLGQEPDFIFGWRTSFAPQTLGDVHYWHNLGVKTFTTRNTTFNPRTVEYFFEDIEDIGRIFKIEDRVEKFAAEARKDMDYISSKIPPPSQRPRVALISTERPGLVRAYGPKTLAGDMLKLAGGLNAFAESGNYSMEGMIEANPDIIVLIHYVHDPYSMPEQIEMLRNNPLLREIIAVKVNKIYGIPLSDVYSAGVRIPEGIKRLATYLYPEKFHDIRP